jgi:CheY-like chemotaxis protein
VLEASDGGEVLAALGQARPDLVLMDLSMPALDGLSATCRLREIPEMRDVPVVALTAHSAQSHREAAFAAGCDEFVAKTVGADELRGVVSRLLSEGRGGGDVGRRMIASEGMDSEQLLDAIERHLSRG